MEQTPEKMGVFTWKEPIGLAFEKTKERFGFVLGVIAVGCLVQVAPNIIEVILKIPKEGGIHSLFSVIGWVISVYMSAGIIRVLLRVVRGEETKIDDLFADPELVPRYMAASSLYGLIVLVGFLLLFVPGMIWSIKYGMFGYFLVEHKVGIGESLKRSAELTEGSKWQLFFFGLANAGIMILGVLALGIGVLFALPLVSVAHAYAYILLSRRQEELNQSVVSAPVEIPAAIADSDLSTMS